MGPYPWPIQTLGPTENGCSTGVSNHVLFRLHERLRNGALGGSESLMFKMLELVAQVKRRQRQVVLAAARRLLR
jgi:hypothetical protein